MRTFLNAKAMAKSLKATLADSGLQLTHSQALEAVAHQFGLADWNALAAKIEAGQADPVTFEQTSPVFRMFDEALSKAFYVDFLGFQLDWEHRFGDDFPLYCQVSRGDLTLHLSGHHGDATPGSLAYVQMNGVDAFQRELAGRPYKYMKPGVERMPWGKVMEVVDPSQNRIRFCEPDPEE
jgi:catechol 2,3-dioxygenase-like lactoylglutathione lyase family enzyme